MIDPQCPWADQQAVARLQKYDKANEVDGDQQYEKQSNKAMTQNVTRKIDQEYGEENAKSKGKDVDVVGLKGMNQDYDQGLDQDCDMNYDKV